MSNGADAGFEKAKEFNVHRIREIDINSAREMHKVTTGNRLSGEKNPTLQKVYEQADAIVQLQVQLNNIMGRLDALERRLAALEKENRLWHK